MDAARFDHLVRNLSRRGLAALLGGGLLTGRALDAQAADPDFAACGGTTSRLTKFCPWIRTCETNDDCAAPCTCEERHTGCCYKQRGRKRKGHKRKTRHKCANIIGTFCTPPEVV